MVHNGAQMATEPLTAQVKTRIPAAIKSAFEQIAEKRELKAADIYREALREYLERHGMPNGHVEPQLALSLDKEKI